MKVLFISTNPLEYSSSANIRNIALLKGLIELGHQVCTLTATPEKESSYYDSSLLNLQLEKQYYIDIGKIHAQFTSKGATSNSVVLNWLGTFKKKIYQYYTVVSVYDPRRALISQLTRTSIDQVFDIVISSSDPKSSHLLAEKLIAKYPNLAKKWIQYWGDPFTTDINNKTLLPRWIVKREEERMLKQADAAIYVSPFTLSQQQQLFPAIKHKLHFLPVPYMEPLFFPVRQNEHFVVGYYGDFYSSDRNILPLYQAAKKSQFYLYIYGNSDLSLESDDKISVNSRSKYELIKKKEQESDLLICICNKRGTQIPGKVYHYAATNKPILIVLDGDNREQMKKYFEEFKRYILCDNNTKAITEAIQGIKNSTTKYLPSPDFAPDHISKKLMSVVV